MIERDGAFTEARKKFYQEQYRVAEAIDPWHVYSQNIVHSKTKTWFDAYGRHRGSRILNAGSGGSDYGINEPMTHLDLFESRVGHLGSHIIGNIAQIPVKENSFTKFTEKILTVMDKRERLCRSRQLLFSAAPAFPTDTNSLNKRGGF